MCAILDANVAGQVFGMDRPPAAKAFFDRIDSGRVRLLIRRGAASRTRSDQCVRGLASSGGPGRASHTLER